MSHQTAPISLAELQQPLRPRLERVQQELRRIVEADFGLIYWLGRALEAQGKCADAITSYERAMAVDILFMDLSDRIHRLTAGRRE